MIPPRRHKTEETNVDSWLMSYADMITLLMCFFIIFVSVSEPKKGRFDKITEGIAERFGHVDLSTPFVGAYKALIGVIEEHQLLKDVDIEKTEKAINIELASNAFFQPKSAELIKDKISVLDEMVAALRQTEFLKTHVTVSSYTSDAPPESGLYPTNWELSSARSARIVRLMIEQGMKPQTLSVEAYGDSRPKVPNRDGQGNAIIANRLRNERILIKLERQN